MTDHPEYAGLLADVLASPADDAPRLIVADWLEDHGEGEHAEFIRVQLGVARLDAEAMDAGEDCDHPDCAICRERAALRRREEVLAGRNCFRWRADVMPGAPFMNWLTEYRRGFISHVSLPLAGWMDHGPALVRAQPLESVRLTDREPSPDDDEFNWWCAGPERTVDWAEDIPPGIFSFLRGCCREEWGSQFTFYPTADAAHADLSRACLLWARQLPVDQQTAKEG